MTVVPRLELAPGYDIPRIIIGACRKQNRLESLFLQSPPGPPRRMPQVVNRRRTQSDPFGLGVLGGSHEDLGTWWIGQDRHRMREPWP